MNKSHHVPGLLSWPADEVEAMRRMECCVNHRLPYCPASWATQHRVDCPGVRRDA